MHLKENHGVVKSFKRLNSSYNLATKTLLSIIISNMINTVDQE